MSPQTIQRAAPAVVLALALARIALGDPSALVGGGGSGPGAREEPGTREEARRLLGGLGVGDTIEGFEVARVGGPEDGAVVVELHDGARGTRVWIERAGARGADAAARASGFDLFYGSPPPDRETVAEDVALRITQALAARVEESGVTPEDVGMR